LTIYKFRRYISDFKIKHINVNNKDLEKDLGPPAERSTVETVMDIPVDLSFKSVYITENFINLCTLLLSVCGPKSY
jgi:hypothetical protein